MNPRIQADVDQALRLRHLGGTPLLEEIAHAAKGGGAEAQHGYPQTRTAELPVFHELLHFDARRA